MEDKKPNKRLLYFTHDQIESFKKHGYYVTDNSINGWPYIIVDRW